MEKNLKICFLATADSIHSYKWIKFFAERGHEVYWFSLSSLSFEPIKNVKFHQLDCFINKHLDIPYNILKLRRLLQKISPDILHAHYAGLYGFIGALSGFSPFVLTAWGSDVLFAGKHFLKKHFVKYTIKRADIITCDAEHMRESIIRLGVNAKKIHIIYFGIDTLIFHPDQKCETLKLKLGASSSPLIISLRNFEPVYDVSTLIKAIPLVLKEFPDAKFLILGKGSEEEKLKNLAKSLGILNNTNFSGFVPNDELPKYLASSDIYVSTSLSDAGIAASTAEAMACGLPVIVTDSGENKLWIKEGENGFIIPIKSPNALAEKIIFLLKNKDIRIRIGANARKTIEEKNNYYSEMNKMEYLYERVKNERLKIFNKKIS